MPPSWLLEHLASHFKGRLEAKQTFGFLESTEKEMGFSCPTQLKAEELSRGLVACSTLPVPECTPPCMGQAMLNPDDTLGQVVCAPCPDTGFRSPDCSSVCKAGHRATPSIIRDADGFIRLEGWHVAGWARLDSNSMTHRSTSSLRHPRNGLH